MTNKQYSSPPEMQIDTSKSYKAKIELEKGGEIIIDLLVKEAPKTAVSYTHLTLPTILLV